MSSGTPAARIEGAYLSADLTESVELAATEAGAAHTSVAALVELLRGCKPDYPLQAGLFLGLLVPVQSELDNVVDGLRVMAQQVQMH